MKYKYLGAFLAFSITAGAFFASSSEASFFRSKKTQDRIDERKGADMPAGLDGRCNPTCIKDICHLHPNSIDLLFNAVKWCKVNCSTGSKTAQPLVSDGNYPANVCPNLAPLPFLDEPKKNIYKNIYKMDSDVRDWKYDNDSKIIGKEASDEPFWRSLETQYRINARKGDIMPAGLDGRCNPTCIKDICLYPHDSLDSLYSAVVWCKVKCRDTREDSETGSKTAQPLVSDENYPANVCPNIAPLSKNRSAMDWADATYFKITGKTFARPNTQLSSSEVNESYSILGLPPRADAASVKKAYDTLALQYDSDQNPNNPEAQEKFEKIKLANETLQMHFSVQKFISDKLEIAHRDPNLSISVCGKVCATPRILCKDEGDLFLSKAIWCISNCINQPIFTYPDGLYMNNYPKRYCSLFPRFGDHFRESIKIISQARRDKIFLSPVAGETPVNVPADIANPVARRQSYGSSPQTGSGAAPSIPDEPSSTYQPVDSARPIIGNHRRQGSEPRSQRASEPTQRFNDAPPAFPTTQEGIDALRMRSDVPRLPPYQEGKRRIENYGASNVNRANEQEFSDEAPYSNTPSSPAPLGRSQSLPSRAAGGRGLQPLSSSPNQPLRGRGAVSSAPSPYN